MHACTHTTALHHKLHNTDMKQTNPSKRPKQTYIRQQTNTQETPSTCCTCFKPKKNTFYEGEKRKNRTYHPSTADPVHRSSQLVLIAARQANQCSHARATCVPTQQHSTTHPSAALRHNMIHHHAKKKICLKNGGGPTKWHCVPRPSVALRHTLSDKGVGGGNTRMGFKKIRLPPLPIDSYRDMVRS